MWSRIIDSTFFSILYPATLILSVVVGYYVASRFYIRKNIEWKASGVESAVIGFFALMISFTFLSSNNAMKERNNLVHQLADGTADLRRQSLFVSDTLKEQTKHFLIAYLEQISFITEEKTDQALFIKEVSEIGGSYLRALTVYAKQGTVQMQESNMLLPFFHKINSLSYRILYSYKERTPILIMFLIIIASWLIGILIGFMNGFHKKKHYLVPTIFIILVALSLQTIRDLDNPARGSIQPDYDNFQQQKDFLINSSR